MYAGKVTLINPDGTHAILYDDGIERKMFSKRT